MEFTVKVSFMEIYMEKIRDLLNRKYNFVVFCSQPRLHKRTCHFGKSHDFVSSGPCATITLYHANKIPPTLLYISYLCINAILSLAAANDNLPIHEDKTRGVYVKGLFEVYVSSVQEIHEVMRRGGAARMVAYTSESFFFCSLGCSFLIKIN